MEQEQILSELKNRSGLSGETAFDRTLTTYVSKNLPSDGVDPDEEYWNKHSDIIKSITGQYSHDVATEINNFKKNFKPVEQQKQEPKKNEDEIPDYVKELRDKLASIENKELEKQKSVQSEQLINSAYEDAKKSGAENEAVLKIVKRFVSVEDGDTPISLKNKIVAQYNETYKELYGEGAAPSSSSGGSGNKKASIESTKAYFKQTGRLKETK